jgi:hypothetical protein
MHRYQHLLTGRKRVESNNEPSQADYDRAITELHEDVFWTLRIGVEECGHAFMLKMVDAIRAIPGFEAEFHRVYADRIHALAEKYRDEQ